MTTLPAADQGPSTQEVCESVLREWQEIHGVAGPFDEEMGRVFARARTWVSTASVIAGVGDIFGIAHPGRAPLSRDAVKDLGDRMGMRLRDHGLLFAQPKRGGILSG